MSTLFDLDNSSDSEDDFDYQPPADEISSDEEDPIPHSDDEEDSKKKSKRSRKSAKSELDLKEKATEENKPVENTTDVKKKADDIYKSFLEEVEAEMKETKPESVSSGISCCGSTTSSPVVLSSGKTSPSVASNDTPEKLFDFAGETIAVVDGTVKSVDSGSSKGSPPKAENKATTAVAPVPTKKRGLESVLGSIQSKKQKITVMQKSLLDWKTFKKEEGLNEELEKFNRGKGGFIERQRFLQRSDVRSYEIERDMRMTKRPTQTKRDV